MSATVPPRAVAQAKITRYLLNPTHKLGGPKSVFFRAFGFSVDRWEIMAAALAQHPDRNPVEKTISDRWGLTFVVRCNIKTPDRRNPCILSVWIVRPGRPDAEFVTAYPAAS
ncbi:DUF6883 domain-containing protein [Methylobacterium sp. J-090]|uniref:DUF6883 domain-containing protein n=1 Tax=Methylobacterium sp. J-090 TaxID=2836666 RepID=UPI001FB87206|nr:DUF6883 domain-containing protein [Methylobacterium sp. J-090]MCJ2083333.1 hypothetical protein [Methylobacterium sp. J-090]